MGDAEGGYRMLRPGDYPGLKYESVCHFILAVDMFRGGVSKPVYDAFLERELMGFGVDVYR